MGKKWHPLFELERFSDGVGRLAVEINLGKFRPILADGYQTSLAAPLDSFGESIRVEDKVSVVRLREDIVQVLLEFVFVCVRILLKVRFYGSQVAKDVMWWIEIVRRGVLLPRRI